MSTLSFNFSFEQKGKRHTNPKTNKVITFDYELHTQAINQLLMHILQNMWLPSFNVTGSFATEWQIQHSPPSGIDFEWYFFSCRAIVCRDHS